MTSSGRRHRSEGRGDVRSTRALRSPIGPPPPPTPDFRAYFDRIPDRWREEMERIRRIVRSAAPSAAEVLSYRIPAFRQHGILVYFAAFEEHCSFFIGSAKVRRAFARETAPFEHGKGSLHSTEDLRLPATLLRRIVRARVRENEARATAKGGPGTRVRLSRTAPRSPGRSVRVTRGRARPGRAAPPAG